MAEDRFGYSHTSVRSYKTGIHWSQLICVRVHAFLHPATVCACIWRSNINIM